MELARTYCAMYRVAKKSVLVGVYELIFISVFNGNLYTLDDRTGVVYQVSTL
jgi:hypothetical protein